MAEGSAHDDRLEYVLSKVSSTLPLALVPVVSSYGASGVTPAEVEDSTPGEATGASPGEIERLTPDVDETPASCGSVPVCGDGSVTPDDGAPVPVEGISAPVDDAPAVVDDLFLSRLLACCRGLSYNCTRWCSISATVSSSGVLSWICACCRFVSATVASSDLLLPLLYVHVAANACPPCSDTPYC